MYNEKSMSFISTYYDDPYDGTLRLELCCNKEGRQIFLHADIHNWSLSALRKHKEIFKNLKEDLLEIGFVSVYTYTNNAKWCNMLEKAESLGNIIFEGKEYEVLKWDLAQPLSVPSDLA